MFLGDKGIYGIISSSFLGSLDKAAGQPDTLKRSKSVEKADHHFVKNVSSLYTIQYHVSCPLEAPLAPRLVGSFVYFVQDATNDLIELRTRDAGIRQDMFFFKYFLYV